MASITIKWDTGCMQLDPEQLVNLPLSNMRKIAKMAYYDSPEWWDKNLQIVRDWYQEHSYTGKGLKRRKQILQVWEDMVPAPADPDAVQLSKAAAAAVKRIVKGAKQPSYYGAPCTSCIADGYHGVSYPYPHIPGAGDISDDHGDIIRQYAAMDHVQRVITGIDLETVRRLQKTGMDENGNAATHLHISGVGYYNIQYLVDVLTAIDAPCTCYARKPEHGYQSLVFWTAEQKAGWTCGIVAPYIWDETVSAHKYVAVDLPAADIQADAPAETPAEDPAEQPAEQPAECTTPAPILDTDIITAALQPAEQPAEDPSIMDRLQAIPGLDIAVKKSTIWISGQTYPARAQLKAMGCRWSAKRKAWYYQAPRPAAVIPDGLTVVKQTSACTWVDGPADLLQAAGAKWSAKRQAWYVA